jgi:hypothetical protein
MDREIGGLDKCVRPHTRHELLFGNQFARPLEQGNEDIEGTAADMDRLVVLQQEPLYRPQTERAKTDRGRRRLSRAIRLRRLVDISRCAFAVGFDPGAAIEPGRRRPRGRWGGLARR